MNSTSTRSRSEANPNTVTAPTRPPPSWCSTARQRSADAVQPSSRALPALYGSATSMRVAPTSSRPGSAAASRAMSMPCRAISSTALSVQAWASSGVPARSARASSLRTRPSVLVVRVLVGRRRPVPVVRSISSPPGRTRVRSRTDLPDRTDSFGGDPPPISPPTPYTALLGAGGTGAARRVVPPSYAGRAMADPATYRPAPGSVPEEPGVYRFSDAAGRVIYVGKAKSLRSRLNSYFADLAHLHPRTRQMVTTAARVQWTVVGTEVEALQLEYNWIKEFDPRFNVRYRDDKTYPVLAVTVGEEFPRLHVYRGPRRKGVRYFGPYAHAWAIRETLDLLLRVFPARTCSAGVFRRHGQIGRPCLLGYIDKCSAPCVGRVTADEHRDIVDDFCEFLSGRTDRLVRELERRMAAAADGAGVREGGPAARRPRRAAPGDGEAGRGARRRHRRRRGRLRPGRARGRGAGLPRARRPGPRPARLGDRQGRAHRDARAGRAVPHPVLRRAGRARGVGRRRRPARAAGDPRARAAPGRRRAGRVAVRACAAPACRSASRSAATSGPWPRPSSATPRRPSPSTSCAAPATSRPAPRRCRRSRTRSGSTARRCASSASTSRTCRAPTSSRRWWCSRTGWPASRTTGASRSAAAPTGGDVAAIAEVVRRRFRRHLTETAARNGRWA